MKYITRTIGVIGAALCGYALTVPLSVISTREAASAHVTGAATVVFMVGLLMVGVAAINEADRD